MTAAQKLDIRASEIRQRLNEIAGMDGDLPDDVQAESDRLTTEYASVETKRRAALTAEAAEQQVVEHATEPDSESRERANLRRKATLGGYLAARIAGVLPGGALAEYGAACGAEPGTIPLDLFEGEPRPAVETHADATTPAPSTGTGQSVGRLHPWIFNSSIAARRLGISMPQVGSGSYSELTIGTPLAAGARTKGEARESSAGALSTVTTKPRSISARLSIAAEDVAEIGTAQFEPALRANLQGAIGDEYDSQCTSGSGTAPNVQGLIPQLTRPTNPTAVADFDSMLSTAAGFVGTKWAESARDVSILVPADTYRLSMTAFRDAGNNHRGDISAQRYLSDTLASWATAPRLPVAPTSGANDKISTGIVRRMGQGVVGAVHPVWTSIHIDDVYSDSASAVRHVTLHVLVGAKVMLTRPAGEVYDLASYKVTA